MSDATNGAAEVSQQTKNDVAQQVEFYLSDSNLPFDKFLFSLWSASFNKPRQVILDTPVDSSANVDTLNNNTGSLKHDRFHLGWIPLDTLCSFKRMRDYLQPPPQGLGSQDAVANAVKEGSNDVQVYKFGKDGQEEAGWYVRKTSELKKAGDVLDRSAYAKGFPVPEGHDDETDEGKKAQREAEAELQKKIEAWVKDLGVGKALSVRMRREDKQVNGKTILKAGKFKGSIFIEFAETESVDKFVKLDPKPEFEGKPLEVMTKTAYVDMKREIYAPGSAKQAEKNGKGSKGFNAWALKYVDSNGFPAPVENVSKDSRDNSKKRKADDGPEERDVMFDGVRFKAKRTKEGDDSSIELVDEDKIGTEEGQWPKGRLLKFTLSGDGSNKFNFMELKGKIATIAKPGFIGLEQPKGDDQDRPVANLPSSSTTAAPSSHAMVDTIEQPKPKLDAPPMVASASAVKEEAKSDPSAQRGTASFREVVSDEAFDKIKSEFSDFEGQKLEWSRASDEEERKHVLSRARWHAKEAFSSDRGGNGGRGGRGGGRGGRGGRGGNSKRARR
ncbi:hypothetical protein ACM66B_001625 [Microbotryomycetes sp. NB124-2]